MGSINVKSFGGAIGDGITNDRKAIQDTICHAISVGGTVYFPAGVYRISCTIKIDSNVSISGAGWNDRWNGEDYKKNTGSWIYIDKKEVTAFKIRRASGTIIRDIAVAHKQPGNRSSKNWSPTDYAYAIDIDTSNDVVIENVHLHNPTNGIVIHWGRHTLEKISGNPLKTGIYIRHSRDVIRINSVHFWRYWSSSKGVSLYTARKGVAIKCERADNPMFSRIFAIGYSKGIHFTKGKHGITKRFQLDTIDFDSAVKGIVMDAAHISGQLTNYTYKGRNTKKEGGVADGWNAILVNGGDILLQVSNANISTCKHNAVRVSGDNKNSNTRIMIENAYIHNYDFVKKGFPGIEALKKSCHSHWFKCCFGWQKSKNSSPWKRKDI
jgi:hypothetical protein